MVLTHVSSALHVQEEPSRPSASAEPVARAGGTQGQSLL